MTPMKIIMYFITFCCMAEASSVGGGMNSFCCQMNSPTVINGRMFKKGPSQPVGEDNMAGTKSCQSQNMSGAARFEHHRTDSPNNAACRNSTSTISERYNPMKIG